MKPMTVAEAFTAYEAARPRLPPTLPPKSSPRQIQSLADVADDFDVFLLDAFGVLNVGDSAIDGAPERVRDLQAAGKRVMVVSNAASVPAEDLLQKYGKLGFAFSRDDLVTSRMATIAGLHGMPPLSWGVMGLSGVSMQDFGDLHWTLLEDDSAAYSKCDAFLLVGSGDWTEQRQEMLHAELARKPRPVWVANPDIVAPRETAFSIEPGHFGHVLAEQTNVSPAFFGKPFMNIYDLAFDRLEPQNKSRIVMVGDSLHTDILGAQTAGISSVLISDFGFFARGDLHAAIAQSGIVPDFIAPRP